MIIRDKVFQDGHDQLFPFLCDFVSFSSRGCVYSLPLKFRIQAGIITYLAQQSVKEVPEMR